MYSAYLCRARNTPTIGSNQQTTPGFGSVMDSTMFRPSSSQFSIEFGPVDIQSLLSDSRGSVLAFLFGDTVVERGVFCIPVGNRPAWDVCRIGEILLGCDLVTMIFGQHLADTQDFLPLFSVGCADPRLQCGRYVVLVENGLSTLVVGLLARLER